MNLFPTNLHNNFLLLVAGATRFAWCDLSIFSLIGLLVIYWLGKFENEDFLPRVLLTWYSGPSIFCVLINQLNTFKFRIKKTQTTIYHIKTKPCTLNGPSKLSPSLLFLCHLSWGRTYLVRRWVNKVMKMEAQH